MKAIDPDDFRILKSVKLLKLPTLLITDAEDSEKEAELAQLRNKLSELQDVMYAHNRYSVLVCLQGMDTSGKDSLIREVFKEINARGVEVSSFKQPTSNELEHDYLWRHYVALPEKGKIGVFNRTHYENVLVSRVHPENILNERLPGIEKVEDIQPDFWKKRFKQINNFEKHLVQNGTIILKFYLHLSKDEQKNRLLRRLEEEKHNWKFSPADLKEREYWDQYMAYFEDIINNTSGKKTPWFVIPADDKDMARYIVAKIIWEELSKYKDIKIPELDDEVKEKVGLYIKNLKEE
ncbi:MAG: polyphosphate kinase 2 family protein [Flavobacterium sp.]|nr:polyphosphate kinase 2 family protein [Flavobacterium sp.]